MDISKGAFLFIFYIINIYTTIGLDHRSARCHKQHFFFYFVKKYIKCKDSNKTFDTLTNWAIINLAHTYLLDLEFYNI